MDNKERLTKMMDDIFQSAKEQGHGVYDTVSLDMDDFMFLYRLAENAVILMEEAPKVYEEVSGLTKLNTPSKAVIKSFNENYIGKDTLLDDVRTMADEGEIKLSTLERYIKN